MKYKYYVVAVSTKSDDEREILKTNSKEEAIKEAKEEDFTNRRDGNDEKVEIRMYEEDIESEDCECFDYDTSMELENNHDHKAWDDLYQQYLED